MGGIKLFTRTNRGKDEKGIEFPSLMTMKSYTSNTHISTFQDCNGELLSSTYLPTTLENCSQAICCWGLL